VALAIIVAYLAVVLAIGLGANRLLRGTGEDYFVAARSIGPVVLLLSLFGTNMTAFAILGASAEAFQEGIAVFGKMASASALVIPLIFYFVGTRIWAIGKRFGYLSPVQFFRERFASEGFGLLYFVLVIAFVAPHLLTAPIGGGAVLRTLTGGVGKGFPLWVGALLICAPVLVYVFFGGMRGTAWVQSFETLVFMVFGIVIFSVIFSKMGGIGEAIRVVADHPRPEVRGLLQREGNIGQLEFLSFTLIPLSVGTFPHMWIHLLTARTVKTFRLTLVAYPICIALVWVPSVYLGVVAAGQYFGKIPDREVNSVLIRLIDQYSPGILGGLVGASVFAAIMSTLDSQILSIGSMFTNDVATRVSRKPIPEKTKVLIGRSFVVLLLTAAFFGALFAEKDARRIFDLSIWSFTGFAGLFPIAAGAIFWRRANKYGAYASALTVVSLLVGSHALADWGREKTVDIGRILGLAGPFHLMPVLAIVPCSAAALVLGSLLTPPPPAGVVRKFFPVEREPAVARVGP
jgi:SSS family solute:Na+ symporter